MINERPIGFCGYIEWIHYDPDGNELDRGETPNQIQNLLLDSVIDAMDTGTFPAAFAGMAIGIGSGASIASDNLMSLSSAEACNPTQPTSVSLQGVATFTATGTWTITEAGFFDAAACTDDMYAYDDSLTVNMTSGDTLHITWTVSVASA